MNEICQSTQKLAVNRDRDECVKSWLVMPANESPTGEIQVGESLDIFCNYTFKL